jgi:Flp pilus assembly protein TadG
VSLRLQRGQAMVEAALAVLVSVPMAVGLIGVARLVEAQAGVNAVAYEVARSAASANDAGEAEQWAEERRDELASPYRLTNGSLAVDVDVSAFGRGRPIHAAATYLVRFDDIPLLGWASHEVTGQHTESVELYRSIHAEVVR